MSSLPSLDWYLDNVVVPSGPRDVVGLTRVQRWRRVWSDLAATVADPRIQALVVSQGFVLSYEQAIASGMTPAQLRRHIRAGRWTRLRRAVFTPVRIPDGDAREALEAAAAALAWPGSVVSHESAALLHGLPVLHRPKTPIVTVVSNDVTGRRSKTLARSATLHAGDLGTWFGVRLTSPARTVVDLARHDRRSGLVVADASMRYKLCQARELNVALDGCRGWMGSRAAAWVVQNADPLAESPLESLTREAIVGAGLPAPELQAWIEDEWDGWRCRVDMIWRHRQVVLEADGRIKYDDRQALWDEKVRQERLERLGFRVVRVMWSDVIGDPGPTVNRLRALLVA